MKNLFLSISLCAFIQPSFAIDKIVGGSLVDPDTTDISFIVNLGNGCSGSIIAEKWILTAAHCEPAFGKFVTAGHVNVRSKERIKLAVKRGYTHPKYNPKTYSYDIALIELRYPIHFENMELNPIALLTPELAEKGAVRAGVVGTAMGWGAVREGGSYSNLLMTVDLPIISHEVANAKEAYNGAVDETMIPAGYAKGKKDTCQGDSGGPFTIVGSDGKPVLAGVISWGNGCAQENRYGLYANVAMGYSWVMEMLNKH